MKQAIVTGATGFIGAYFVEYLVKKNISVLAIGRKEFSEISEKRKKRLLKAINLAWGGESKLSDLDVNIQMQNVIWSVNAFQIANDIGCNRFLQIGTMEEAFTYKYLDLDYKVNDEYNRHVIYSVAKIAAKKALQIISKELKIELIYVLHSHVMAPDDDKDSFLQVTLQKLINKSELVFSTGEQTFDVVSEVDCAVGYYLICQKGIPESEYWVGSGDPRPLREYVERMYSLYPSGKEMQFGKYKYNDIKLSKKDFSIQKLVEDTGYKPQNNFEEIVLKLHSSLILNQ